MSNRRGSTLLELLVALAVMAVALGVATVAFRVEAEPDAAARAQAAIARVRTDAMRLGRPLSVRVELDSGVVEGTAYPDGRVLMADARLAQPMTGRPHVE